MFGAAGDCAGAWGVLLLGWCGRPVVGAGELTFFSDFLFDVCTTVADVYVLRQRRVGYVAVHVGTCLDQIAFAVVPGFEDFMRGSTA